MRSLLGFLALSLVPIAPASAALVARTEVSVTATTPDVAPFDQAVARLASDGDAFLAVWADRDLAGSGDLHAMRLDAQGARIDANPFVIASSDEDDNRPAIVWGADRYLVVWSTPTRVAARFVARDGRLSNTITLATGHTSLTRPHVAFNGRVFLVVWEAPGLIFRGAIVDTAGHIERTFDVVTATLTWPEVALVSVGDTFYFVTAKIDVDGASGPNGFPADVGAAPIDENGVVGTRIVIAPATTPVFDLSAAARRDDFFAGWTTARGVGGAQVRYATVTAAGAQPVESFTTDLQFLHDVAATSTGYVLIYGDDFVKQVRRAGGTTSTPVPAPPSTPSSVLDTASNGLHTLAIVRGFARLGFEFGPAGGDLYVTRLYDATNVLTPLVLAPRHQESPDVAAAGDLRLAVWCEYAGSDRALSVVASRIRTDDVVLDPEGIDFGVDVYHPTRPRVASNGTDWLAVWVDARTLYGARIERGGAVTGPIEIADGVFENTDVDVAWDGASYVVVFTRGMFLRGLRTTVYAARVSAGGAVSSPEIALSGEAANEHVTIAGGGEGSLTIWRSGTTIQGAMLSRGGTIAPVVPGIAPLAPYPFVAWNGQTFLVATSTPAEVRTAYVSASGVVTSTGPRFVIPFYAEGYAWAAFSDERFPVRIAPALAVVHGEGSTIVYARRIGHRTRELARVFARKIEDLPLRRRAVTR